MQAMDNEYDFNEQMVKVGHMNFTHLFFCTSKFNWSELFFVVIRKGTFIKRQKQCKNP